MKRNVTMHIKMVTSNIPPIPKHHPRHLIPLPLPLPPEADEIRIKEN